MTGIRTGVALEDSSSASPTVVIDCAGGEKITALVAGCDVVLGETVVIGRAQTGVWAVISSPDSGGVLVVVAPPPPPT